MEYSNCGTSKNKKKRGCSVFPFFLAIIVSLFVGYVVFPQILYSKKTQPFTFNHKKHVEEVGLDCATCHTAGENGSFSGLPKLETCAECHTTPQGTSKNEAVLIKDYIEPNKEIPWVVYNKMPDNVYFSHDAHSLNSCNAPGCHNYTPQEICAQCHIPVWTMAKEPIAQLNRLTGYMKTTMTMDACERCHALEQHRDGKTNANNLCATCHK